MSRCQLSSSEVESRWDRLDNALAPSHQDLRLLKHVDFACLLIGLGIRELSLSPGRGVVVRQALNGSNSQAAAETADQALRCQNPGEVRELLAELRSGEHFPVPIKNQHTNEL